MAEIIRAIVDEGGGERALNQVSRFFQTDLEEEDQIWGCPGVHIVVLDEEDDGVRGKATLGRLDSRHDYVRIAFAKAKMANREQCDTGDIVATNPHLLAIGDTYYRGGCYFDSFSVGVSGLEGYDDEAVSRIVGALIVADCARELESTMKKGGDFI